MAPSFSERLAGLRQWLAADKRRRAGLAAVVLALSLAPALMVVDMLRDDDATDWFFAPEKARLDAGRQQPAPERRVLSDTYRLRAEYNPGKARFALENPVREKRVLGAGVPGRDVPVIPEALPEELDEAPERVFEFVPPIDFAQPALPIRPTAVLADVLPPPAAFAGGPSPGPVLFPGIIIPGVGVGGPGGPQPPPPPPPPQPVPEPPAVALLLVAAALAARVRRQLRLAP